MSLSCHQYSSFHGPGPPTSGVYELTVCACPRKVVTSAYIGSRAVACSNPVWPSIAIEILWFRSMLPSDVTIRPTRRPASTTHWRWVRVGWRYCFRVVAPQAFRRVASAMASSRLVMSLVPVPSPSVMFSAVEKIRGPIIAPASTISALVNVSGDQAAGSRVVVTP